MWLVNITAGTLKPFQIQAQHGISLLRHYSSVKFLYEIVTNMETIRISVSHTTNIRVYLYNFTNIKLFKKVSCQTGFRGQLWKDLIAESIVLEKSCEVFEFEMILSTPLFLIRVLYSIIRIYKLTEPFEIWARNYPYFRQRFHIGTATGRSSLGLYALEGTLASPKWRRLCGARRKVMAQLYRQRS